MLLDVHFNARNKISFFSIRARKKGHLIIKADTNFMLVEVKIKKSYLFFSLKTFITK